MKHAGPQALDQLEPLLVRLRALTEFTEKGRGLFYLKGRAALHFHEDASGLYADLRLSGSDFDRLKADTPEDQDALIERIKAS